MSIDSEFNIISEFEIIFVTSVSFKYKSVGLIRGLFDL